MGSPTIRDRKVRATLARNVRSLLRFYDLSESALARRSGVSQKQVNNIVRERYGCSVEALRALGRALDVPYWMLLIPGITDDGADPARMRSEARRWVASLIPAGSSGEPAGTHRGDIAITS